VNASRQSWRSPARIELVCIVRSPQYRFDDLGLGIGVVIGFAARPGTEVEPT
jgi:hypothetical protein